MKEMTVGEALQKLDIADYGSRILASNSRGEMFHLLDYIYMAETFKDPTWFRPWFVAVVAWAEKNWERPESIFQHMPRMLEETAKTRVK